MDRTDCVRKVTLNFISAKWIPCLLYASEALSLNSSPLKSLNFSAKPVLFKIFKTASPDVISYCQESFNFPDVSELILKCKTSFLNGLLMNNNMLCYVKFDSINK